MVSCTPDVFLRMIVERFEALSSAIVCDFRITAEVQKKLREIEKLEEQTRMGKELEPNQLGKVILMSFFDFFIQRYRDNVRFLSILDRVFRGFEAGPDGL